MIQKFADTFARNIPREFEMFTKLFAIVLQGDDEYSAFVSAHLSQTHRYQQRKGLLKARFFGLPDLHNLLHAAFGPDHKGTNVRNVAEFLKRLVEWSLVIDNDFGDGNSFARYKWNPPLIGLFSTLRIIDNVMLGRTYIVDKYARSCPSIIVEKNGVEQVGTGFLAHDHYSGEHFSGQGCIVTAKHNVDPRDNIKFIKFEGTAIYEPLVSEWILHPERDMAAMPVSTGEVVTPIYPFGEPTILSRTISLGYPTISSTDRAYLLAHNGELNAIVTSYLDQKQYLLISNDVAPGSSGGPVLDDAGLCIGMVVRALEGEYEGGVSKANAAIPSSEIQNFISSISKV